jgi:hypothetical protein
VDAIGGRLGIPAHKLRRSLVENKRGSHAIGGFPEDGDRPILARTRLK